MPQILKIRRTMRYRRAHGLLPMIEYGMLMEAQEVVRGLNAWAPCWGIGDERDVPGEIYKTMMQYVPVYD